MGVHKYSFKQLCLFIKNNPLAVMDGKILTLSRYSFPNYVDCVAIAKEVGIRLNIEEKYIDDKYSVDKIILKGLGFAQIDTMDISKYDGADIIHDLNQPVPSSLKNSYDFILDGGTMEHIFNFPEVIKNIFIMLKTGGTFFFDAPYWFHPHHGYYSFSPELLIDYFEINKWKILRLQPYVFSNENEVVEFPPISLPGNPFPSMYGLLNGIVLKTTITTFDAIPQQGSYNFYWNKYDNLIDTLNNLLADTSVYIFGAGETARQILNVVCKIRPVLLKGVVSDNPSEIGIPFMHGLRVRHIDRLMAGDTILIGSFDHQDAIADRLHHLAENGVRVMKLFHKPVGV